MVRVAARPWRPRVEVFAERQRAGIARLTSAGTRLPDVVPGTREDRSELAAHQTRSQNADAHGALPLFPGSETGSFLQGVGISRPLHRYLRSGALDVVQI